MIANGFSHSDLLHEIIDSGRYQGVAQHIALVLWAKADPRTCLVALSQADLAAITGWNRKTVNKHLDDLAGRFVETRRLGAWPRKTELRLVGLIPEGGFEEDILDGAPTLSPDVPLRDNPQQTTMPTTWTSDVHYRDNPQQNRDVHQVDNGRLDVHFRDNRPIVAPAENHGVVPLMDIRDGVAPEGPPIPPPPTPPSPPTPRAAESWTSQRSNSYPSNGGEGVRGGTPWSASLTNSAESPSEGPLTAEPEPAAPMLFAELSEPKAPRPILPTSRVVDHAIDAYNAAASKHGWEVCKVRTSSRTTRVAKRLTDIGGLEAWKLALLGVTKDEFLSGRVGGRNGQPPFRLSLERLMQTDGNLGDVLARMLDLGMQPDVPAPIDGKVWGWWTDKLDRLRGISEAGWRKLIDGTRPNGQWPWHKLGAPPGHPECAVPQSLLSEFGFVEKYRGQIKAQTEGGR